MKTATKYSASSGWVPGAQSWVKTHFMADDQKTLCGRKINSSYWRIEGQSGAFRFYEAGAGHTGDCVKCAKLAKEIE